MRKICSIMFIVTGLMVLSIKDASATKPFSDPRSVPLPNVSGGVRLNDLRDIKGIVRSMDTSEMQQSSPDDHCDCEGTPGEEGFGSMDGDPDDPVH